MVTKTKAPAKKVTPVAVKKITNNTIQKPVAKALTVKAPARTVTQEKTVTKAIKVLNKTPVVSTPKETKAIEKKLDVVMKKTQTVMKKEIAKTPVKVAAKKSTPLVAKKVVKAKPVVKPVINKIATKDLLKTMEDSIAKAVS